MGGALGGRARPERPGEAVLALRGEGHQCIPQGLGLLGHCCDLAFAVLRFVGVEALLDVSTPVVQQALDQTSRLVCGGRDGFWGAEACFHPPQEGSQGTLRVVQSPGGEAQGDGDAMRPGAHPPRQHLATRNFVLGTQPQPAPEVFHARPPVHVRADLAEDDQGGAFFDAFDGRQVDAGQVRERGTSIKAGFVGLCVSAGLGGQRAAGTFIVKGREMRFDLLIALGHLLVIEVIQLDGLASGKQMLGAPRALQCLGDVVLIVVAVRIAQLREVLRVTLAREDGLEDSHAGHPGDLTDDLGELEMHLFSGFVHMLHMVGGVGQEHLPMPQITTQHAHVSFGPKGTSEEPVGMQALQPLAIEPIGFRSAGGALRLAGINQQDLQTTRLQELEQRNPVDTGGCHGDGGHATVNEPVGQGVEVGGEGAKTTHGLGVAPWGHGDPVLGFTNVDARSVRVADLESFGEHG
jgi:hypothetical protein